MTQTSSSRLILSLVVTGFLSAVILSGVYSMSLPRIRANQAQAVQKAVFRVLPGTTSYTILVLEQDGLKPFQGEAGTEPADTAIYAGFDRDKQPTGYAIPAMGPGFMDSIKILYGYQPEKQQVVGLAVLESRETPGLGSKIETDAAFLASFLGLDTQPPVVAVATKQKANEVDAISGATISSVAVVSIINTSLMRVTPYLEKQAGGSHDR